MLAVFGDSIAFIAIKPMEISIVRVGAIVAMSVNATVIGDSLILGLNAVYNPISVIADRDRRSNAILTGRAVSSLNVTKRRPACSPIVGNKKLAVFYLKLRRNTVFSGCTVLSGCAILSGCAVFAVSTVYSVGTISALHVTKRRPICSLIIGNKKLAVLNLKVGRYTVCAIRTGCAAATGNQGTTQNNAGYKKHYLLHKKVLQIFTI